MRIESSTVHKAVALVAFSAASGWVGHAVAGNLEPADINLGATSFYDGLGRTEQGFTYHGYYQYASLNHITDNSGNDASAFNHPEIDIGVINNQFVYNTDKTLFSGDGHLGFMVIVPTVFFHTHFDQPGVQLSDNGNGMSDISFGTYIQFNPVMSGGRPVFAQRIEIGAIAPAGKYDPNKNLNPGSNFWSINPYWAATWLPSPKIEVSWRAHYLYNFANYAPAGVTPAVVKAQAGRAGWINFATSYAVTPKFDLGINGYYFKQFSGDRWTYADGSVTDGAELGDSGEVSMFAVGPGAQWNPNEKNHWSFNVYFRTAAHNTTRGTVFNVHWIHAF